MSDEATAAGAALPAALPQAREVIPPRPRGRPPGSGNKSLVTEKRIGNTTTRAHSSIASSRAARSRPHW